VKTVIVRLVTSTINLNQEISNLACCTKRKSKPVFYWNLQLRKKVLSSKIDCKEITDAFIFISDVIGKEIAIGKKISVVI